MKNSIFIFLIISCLISCQKEINSNPSVSLSKEEISNFKFKIVRYYEALPTSATHLSKWDTINNDYYSKKANASDLLHYYKDENDFVYFAIAKIAPSLKLKKVATIGKLKIEKDSIVYYEEICRTWKMEVPELKKKTKIIFDKIVNQKDITEYFTKNSQPDFWIEFPDDNTIFDTVNRVWELRK